MRGPRCTGHGQRGQHGAAPGSWRRCRLPTPGRRRPAARSAALALLSDRVCHLARCRTAVVGRSCCLKRQRTVRSPRAGAAAPSCGTVGAGLALSDPPQAGRPHVPCRGRRVRSGRPFLPSPGVRRRASFPECRGRACSWAPAKAATVPGGVGRGRTRRTERVGGGGQARAGAGWSGSGRPRSGRCPSRLPPSRPLTRAWQAGALPVGALRGAGPHEAARHVAVRGCAQARSPGEERGQLASERVPGWAQLPGGLRPGLCVAGPGRWAAHAQLGRAGRGGGGPGP